MTLSRLDRWDGIPVSALAGAWGVSVVEAYGTLGSTNDRAAELAKGGDSGAMVVVADEQTAGRGRRGTDWFSSPGSGLLMSLVLPASVPLYPHLTLRVGLAAARAVEPFTDLETIGIKWPNDLVLKGRKLAGILTEGVHGRAVVGLGLNVFSGESSLPHEIAASSIALEAVASKALVRSEIAGQVVREILVSCDRNPAALAEEERSELTARDLLIGAALESDTGIRGRGVGIAPDGALMIAEEGGEVHRLVAGRVFPR